METLPMDLAFSIIIPTLNRRVLLARLLQGLVQQQTSWKGGEVLVIDNGSRDGTPEWLKSEKTKFPFLLRILRQPKRGATAARNKGICEARGHLLLFLDDDMVPQAGWLAAHREAHHRRPEMEVGIQGRLRVDPSLKNDPYFEFLEDVFGFPYRTSGQTLSWSQLVAANVSFKRSFVQNTLFDEDFLVYAEDVEWAFRLAQRGLRLYYEPQAEGYHWMSYTRQALVQKWIVAGHSARQLARKHGDGAATTLLNPIALRTPLWKRWFKWMTWYTPAALAQYLPLRMRMVCYAYVQQFYLRKGFEQEVSSRDAAALYDSAGISASPPIKNL